MSISKRVILSFLCLVLFVIGASCLMIVLTWAPDKPVSELTTQWAPAPSQFIDVKGLSVHLRDEGLRNDPVPIMLIHGTSSSLHTWEPWVAALKEQHRVITMDIPGFGLTGPNTQNDYSNAAYTQFILDLMDKLQLSRVVLGGNSLGGEIAWQVAAAAPARIDKLILVDAAGYPFTPAAIPVGFKIARMPEMAWVMQHTLPRNLMESSVKNVYGNPDKVTPALVDRYEAMTLRAGNRHALGLRFTQLDAGRTADKIKTIKLPTLILWGGKDKLIPPDNAERFHQDIAASKLVLFDQLGHVPQEEDPVTTIAAVKDFLK